MMVTISVKDVSAIPDSQVKSVLLQLGILKDETKDPVNDLSQAWELLYSRTGHKPGVGFSLEVHITDACNGYGYAEHWHACLIEYEEWCRICGRDYEPKLDEHYREIYPHDGNHRWAREWSKRIAAEAFTPQAAICRLLIREVMEKAKE